MRKKQLSNEKQITGVPQETSAGTVGVRVRKPEAEIMKFRIRGCHKAAKSKQLPMVENITLSSHQSREITVSGIVLQR